MRKSVQIMTVLAASLSLGACATTGDRYGNRYSTNDNQLGRAAAGAAIGAATANDRRWYRDNQGYCYYVDGRGDRIYDYNRGC